MQEITQLVSMSKYAGERLDLIQAGGGNSSVKFGDGKMAIKASGFLLSDLDHDRGYSIVDNDRVIPILSHEEVLNCLSKKEREQISNGMLKQAVLTPEFRPSIETYLHALLDKYTLHTHPVTVNSLTCLPDWKERLTRLFGAEILLVEYETPGIELAIRLKSGIERYFFTHQRKPKLIFLQNHGLIVSSDRFEEMVGLTDDVTSRIERHLSLNYARYRQTNRISALINEIGGKNLISYLVEDALIRSIRSEAPQLFDHAPYFPDGLVFLGYKPVQATWNDLQDKMRNYYDQYHEEPKVVLIEDQIYLIAQNVRKAKEMEDVLKLHLMALHAAKGQAQSLPLAELQYLGNWEAEKFRQKM